MPSKTAKTQTKKTARPTGASASKATSKRMTVSVLAQDLKSLEKRLKSADTKNRNALKSLEGVVAGVKAAAKNNTTAQKSALTRGLNLLEVRMETYLERAATDARAKVRSELASVTTSGADLSTLQQAVQAAHTRLDEMDDLQRGSLARLNRHIAGLATSVETRLTDESQARKATSAALDAKIDSVRETIKARIDQVELETADALKTVGDKITEFAAVLEDRAKSSDVDTAERLADLALETQSDFQSVQTDVTTRLEALEIIASAWKPSQVTVPPNPYAPANADDPRIDQMGEMIQSLKDELSRMHARMESGQTKPAPVRPISPNNVVSLPPALETEQDNPYAAAALALEKSAPEPMAANPAPVQVQPSSQPSSNPKPKRQSHIPEEFDPAAFSIQSSAQHIQVPTPIAAPPALLSSEPAPMPTLSVATPQLSPAPLSPAPLSPPPLSPPPLSPPMASLGAYSALQETLPNVEPVMPAPLPVSTYDDPAYAEGEDMRAERIGGNVSKRASLPRLPVSGRNLRVGALAVGIGVVGLFAAKTILGGPETSTTQARQDVRRQEVPAFSPAQNTVQNADLSGSDQFDAQTIAATPPLGTYAETQVPTLDKGSQTSLDAAVQAGNPIAQFQKGLVQLQTGQMEEGARLIRLAANRNQPAAQYRLAKLYESGTGIAKDPITARELIQRAASGGNRIAMHDLGNYHAYGQGGLDRDMAEALDWFTKAAERGVVDSQFNVAFLREGNEGVAADTETALFWYYVAARQGDQGAPDRIGVLSQNFDADKLTDIKTRADRFNPKPVDEAANGVFRNAPWNQIPEAQTASAESSAEILKIRDAQTLLGSLGYEIGQPDGIAGAKTRKAVKSFESVNGLPETGQVTEELIRRLEVATGV